MSTFPRMHVSLYVSNIAQTTEFYTAFFGVSPAKVKPGYAKYVLDKPSLIISFVEHAERVRHNFGHLGFQVETFEEMEQRLQHARTLGLVSKEEMGTACCYAVQDKFWAADPDGYRWEVYYFREDAAFNDPHYALANAEACCIPSQESAVSSELPAKASVLALETIATTNGKVLAEASACCSGTNCC